MPQTRSGSTITCYTGNVNGSSYAFSGAKEVTFAPEVTSIEGTAFSRCNIIIPKTITRIGSKVLGSSSVTFKRTDPSGYDKNSITFGTVSSSQLSVPAGCRDIYANHYGVSADYFTELPLDLTELNDEIAKAELLLESQDKSTEKAEILAQAIEDAKDWDPSTQISAEKAVDMLKDAELLVLGYTYKLTYTVDGEEYYTADIVYGTALEAIDEPTKDGYTFSGWSELPEAMPAEDVTIVGTFDKIDGIILVSEDSNDCTYYNTVGVRQQNLKKGINVVKTANGYKKVLKK